MKLITLCLLILSSVILSSALLTKGHNWGDDFSSYIMQAKSVSEGCPEKFIRDNRFTIEKSARPIGPIAYPWGTSVLLSPFYKMFGLNMLALKTLNLLCYALFLITALYYINKKLSFPFQILFLSLFALNPRILSFYLNNISSDIPFLFFSTLTVFLIGRIVIEERPLVSYRADRILIGLLFAASFFIRSNGALLISTYFATQVIKTLIKVSLANTSNYRIALKAGINNLIHSKRKVLRIVTVGSIPYITFLILTFTWYHIFPQGGSSYFSYYRLLPARVLMENFCYYSVLPAEFFSGIPYKEYLYFITVPFMLMGMKRTFYYNYHMFLYMLFTFLFFTVWPYLEGLRFIIPILPFYVYFMCVELQWLCRDSGFSRSISFRYITIFILSLIVLHFTEDSFYQALSNLENHRNTSNGPFTKNSNEMFEYINKNVPKDAVIVFFKPRAMRMLTNRKSIMVDNPAELTNGDYLCILRKASYDQLQPTSIDNLVRDKHIQLIYKNSFFLLYKIQCQNCLGINKGHIQSRFDPGKRTYFPVHL
jgi:hypothetical protein